MRAESAAAERVEEVRAAAFSWKRADAIGADTLDAILLRAKETRARPAMLWRALVFVFVSLGVLLLLGAFALGARPNIEGFGTLLALFGVGCLAVTELQERTPSLALRGSAGATGFWGVAFLLGTLFILLEDTLHVREPDGPSLLLLASLLLWTAAVWRWGTAASALFAAVSLFLLLGRAPEGRLLWVAFGIGLSLLFSRALDRASWSPSHRTCAAVFVVAGLAAVYAAVNLYVLDHELVELVRITPRGFTVTRASARILAIVGTALLPLAVLAWGVRSRRTFLIDTGLVLSGLSLLTLRTYVHVAPLWVVLCASGGALVAGALLLNRWLEAGAEGERNGFSARPLFTDEARLRALELVPVVAVHAPTARPAEAPGFEGGGGSFGGGGAGGSF